MLDLRIINARILTGEAADGSDLPRAPQGPLGVRDGKIVLPTDPDEPARRTLDAQGNVCCPGFIDIHSHSDYAALYAPDAISKTLAGFTTELNGNCGYGAFPLYGPMKEARRQEYAPHRLEIDWEQTVEYFERCRRDPMALNQGLLIGQGTLRGSVVGLEDRPADASQRAAMAEQVSAAMDAGCFGISTGLVYAPGSFASGAEIEDLVRIVAERGGLYASHLRSESDGLLEALDEFLDVCRKTGCRAQYSHIKAAGTGPKWIRFDVAWKRPAPRDWNSSATGTPTPQAAPTWPRSFCRTTPSAAAGRRSSNGWKTGRRAANSNSASNSVNRLPPTAGRGSSR